MKMSIFCFLSGEPRSRVFTFISNGNLFEQDLCSPFVCSHHLLLKLHPSNLCQVIEANSFICSYQSHT